MADLLKFRKGLHKNLDALAKSAGTIYVTTDEKAMYVDISDTERIRLGQTVTFATLTEFQTFLKDTSPPYSKEAFYYIEDKNALLKWISNSGNTSIGGTNTTGTWKQINSTSDVQANLSNLTQRVTANETSITQLGNRATALETAVGDATNPAAGSIRKRLNDIEAEQIEQNDRLTATEGVANAAKAAIGTDNSGENASGTLYQRIAQNKKDIATNTSSITAINTKVGNSNDTSDKTTAFGRIKALEEANSSDDSRLDALETAVGNKDQNASASGSLFQRVKKNAADIETLDSQVDKNTDDIAGIKGDITTIGQTNTAQQSSIDGLRTDLGVNDKTGTTAFARIKALETTSSNQGDDVEELKDAVKDIQDKNTTQDGLISGNSTAITNLGNTVNTLSGTVDTHGTDIGDLKTRMATAESEINGLQADTANIRADLGTKIGTKTAFQEIAQNQTDIGKLNTSFTTLNNTVSGHTTTIGDHTTDITNLKTAVGASGDTASATGSLYARVKKNANDISGLSTSLGTSGDTASSTGSAYARIKQNANDIAGIKTNITTINGELDKKASKTELNDAKTELLGQINSKIVAANAMEFKGTVNEYSKLPTSNVKIGDTYVASVDFYFPAPNNSTKVEAGDLLVANGTEDATTGLITGTITWEIVNTGYVAAHENKIVDAGSNVLKLQSYTGSDLSSITFAGSGAAKVAVSHSGSTTHTSTVTVSLEWDTF